ncbi:hypothetical protein HJG60_007741 [Phyllostomus discolor]|uniref:Uncharacterized protein n=1 Tax=Phyllostomus discolor TaxID=89673 RepID=A0A834BJB7_9CHIR|nr:hypothetical protein HJG60_007741 [Phyllostomus discolor]
MFKLLKMVPMFSFFPSAFYSTEQTARAHDHSIVTETPKVPGGSGSEFRLCRAGCRGTQCGTEGQAQTHGSHRRTSGGPCPQGKFVMRPMQHSSRRRRPVGAGVGWLAGGRLLYFYLFVCFLLEGKRRRKRGREISVCGCLLSAPYWGPGS